MAHLPVTGNVALSEQEYSERSATASTGTNDRGLKQASTGSTDGLQAIFQCEKCPKVFNRRENLSRHFKTHNSSPSHKCTRCGKGFTRSDLLKRHYIGHERWDQEPNQEGTGSLKRRKLPLRFSDASRSYSQGSGGPFLEGNQTHDQGHMTMDTLQQNWHPRSSNIHGGQTYEGYNIGTTQNPTQPYGHLSQTQVEMIPSNNMVNYPQMGQMDSSFIPFDFSTFLLPTEISTVGNEWFSYDFYSAMQETGDMFGYQIPENLRHYNTEAIPSEDVENEKASPEDSFEPPEISSPPNEASEDDKWPFQWNPNSRRILEAQPIELEDDHPIFRHHDPRYDISEATLTRIKSFLTLPPGREYHQSQQGIFTLPSLKVLNVFISLFFQHFSHQMPVIHHATVNTNTDLPPPLLAAIVVIGATYSHLKHTRRFAIVLLDVVRWHLRIALECDNNLMRDPMIVYAQALICHTGLWVGNKRSFELAEVVRGALVTYIRRLRFGEELKLTPEKDNKKLNVQEIWRHWIREEQQKRLAWVVYAVDSQFPSILNLPPTISLGEVRGLGCPCDEEFWFATTARSWKNLLGPASVPPSRSFSAAVGPFLLLTTLPPRTDSVRGEKPRHFPLPIMNLNAWSAFLVLMTLQHQIFQFHQESMITRSFIDDEVGDLNDSEESSSIKLMKELHAMRRLQLSKALSTFSASYLSPHRANASTSSSSEHFQASSLVLHHLSTILLDVPLSDLQSAIGKDGVTGIAQSLANFSAWARKAPSVAQDVALNAIRSVIFLPPPSSSSNNADTAPYSLITVFLCHVVLYVLAQVASKELKENILNLAANSAELGGNAFLEVLWRGFGVDGREPEPKVLLRSAAERLTRLGTWGAALNLALMLQKRAEM